MICACQLGSRLSKLRLFAPMGARFSSAPSEAIFMRLLMMSSSLHGPDQTFFSLGSGPKDGPLRSIWALSCSMEHRCFESAQPQRICGWLYAATHEAKRLTRIIFPYRSIKRWMTKVGRRVFSLRIYIGPTTTLANKAKLGFILQAEFTQSMYLHVRVCGTFSTDTPASPVELNHLPFGPWAITTADGIRIVTNMSWRTLKNFRK